MNKSLLTLGIVTLLASSSTALLASSVTIPNTFTSGEPAVAAEVNDNFTAVADSVNDNDSRVTTNAGDITTNAGNITNNAGDITTNAGDIITNADDIAALQSGASCSTDMVAVGSLCVDKYEVSVWSTSTGGTQYGLASTLGSADYPCLADGSNCGENAANPTPIYALSIGGEPPSAHITWYQAVQACANVGKRLPTTAEWQMAASGTPSDTDGGCNTGGTIANTDANESTCLSSTGAVNMVGNVWELTADLDNTTIIAGVIGTSDAFLGSSFGGDFSNSGGSSSTKAVFRVAPGVTTAVSGKVGFRCAR